jgi:hypothetical protein
VSDGCTWFNWAEAIWPVRPCCDAHDAGGSLPDLFVCLVGATPWWAWVPIALICAAIPLVMPLLRKR